MCGGERRVGDTAGQSLKEKRKNIIVLSKAFQAWSWFFLCYINVSSDFTCMLRNSDFILSFVLLIVFL